MINIIALLILIMMIQLAVSRSEIERERRATDSWRDTAIMLNNEIAARKRIAEKTEKLTQVLKGVK